MKARTKGQKKRAKRGRPCLPAAGREPTGRRSRRIADNQQREDPMAVATARRIRQHGIADMRDRSGRLVPANDAARDPRWGYALGVLLMGKDITARQHDAGVKYAEDMARYYRLTGVPFPSARAQDMHRVAADTGEGADRAAAAKAARGQMMALRAVLQAVGDIDTGRCVEGVVKSVALLDEPVSHSRIGFLRRGLNALSALYKLPLDAESGRA